MISSAGRKSDKKDSQIANTSAHNSSDGSKAPLRIIAGSFLSNTAKNPGYKIKLLTLILPTRYWKLTGMGLLKIF